MDKKSNRLTFAELYPNLLDSWDYELNTVTLAEVYVLYGKTQFYWKCTNGLPHSYLAFVGQLVSGSKCSVCSSKQVLTGFNDFATQSDPSVLAEWDYEKNNELGLDPTLITLKTETLAWWVCAKNKHSFSQIIGARTGKKGTGCPFCANRQIILGFNDLATTHPHLVPEWHPLNTYKPAEISAGSGRKIKWTCELGHDYEATVYARTRANIPAGCPYCSGNRLLKGFNDLAFKVPQSVAEWSSKNEKSPDSVMSAGKSSILWECSLGHEWWATSSTRFFLKTGPCGCPFCGNKAVLPGFNDLAFTHPDIATEWDYEKNGDFKPTQITFGSTKKRFWVCSDHGSYLMSVSKRTIRFSGCKLCSLGGTSKIERRFFELFQNFDPSAVNGARLPLSLNIHSTMGVDILLTVEGRQVVVEFDGDYWHRIFKDKSEDDLRKTNKLLDAGFTVVRIRGDALPHLPLLHPNLFQVSHIESSGLLRETVSKIFEFLNSLPSLTL